MAVTIKHWRFDADPKDYNSKDYDIWMLKNKSTDKAIVVRRWGRKGTTGQVKVTTHNHFRQAETYIEKVAATRRQHGYDTIKNAVVLDWSASSSRVESVLGAVFERVKTEEIEFVFAGAESSVSDDLPDPVSTGVVMASRENYSEQSAWGTW